MPAILVYARRKTSPKKDLQSDGFGATKRELEIAIEAVVLGGEQVDETLDNIAKQIEDAF